LITTNCQFVLTFISVFSILGVFFALIKLQYLSFGFGFGHIQYRFVNSFQLG